MCDRLGYFFFLQYKHRSSCLADRGFHLGLRLRRIHRGCRHRLRRIRSSRDPMRIKTFGKPVWMRLVFSLLLFPRFLIGFPRLLAVSRILVLKDS